MMNEVRTEGDLATIGGVQVSLQSVYLKDCSYESPNGPRLPNNQGCEPKFQLNMNTSAEEIGPDIREVLLTITLEAKQGEATLYLVEVKQAGVFSIAGASVEDLKRLIGSFCPSVLFPYAREVISDLIVKGGFPNFLLPLVNFDALFAQASEFPKSGLVNYAPGEQCRVRGRSKWRSSALASGARLLPFNSRASALRPASGGAILSRSR